ncbi:hypothetical protein ACA910_009363 [Epithemia clementina (nom. ined.)]
MNTFPGVSDAAAAVLSSTANSKSTSLIQKAREAGSNLGFGSSAAAAAAQQRRHHQLKEPALHSQWGSHSPVVAAMLRGNRMNTCSEVQSILGDCISSYSNDSICKTAAAYFEVCTSQSRLRDDGEC